MALKNTVNRQILVSVLQTSSGYFKSDLLKFQASKSQQPFYVVQSLMKMSAIRQNEVKQNKTMNYEHFIGTKSKRRKPSALREIAQKINKLPADKVMMLAGGLPNVSTFPFKQLSVELKDGSAFKIHGKDLEIALQYMSTSGYPVLVNQLKELVGEYHGVQDWTRQSLLVTCGSTEPMAAALEMVLNEGDTVIIPVPIYTGPIDILRATPLEYICLEQDKDGVSPEQLEQILRERVSQDKPMPKLMYINPTACNPTGRNLSLERRQHLNRLACQYNFLLLEDDPYYHVHFMEEDTASLLSMDTEGRVIRLDSFSKILSSGLRLGYVTGPAPLLRQMELHMQVSTLHTSGLSQVLVSKLLQEWGLEKYKRHLDSLRICYRERRDQMVAACDMYLKDLATWDTPAGGMFLWIRIPVLRDTWSLAAQHCLAQNLLIVPGHAFTPNLAPVNYNYVRLSFSIATPQKVDQGIKLLAEIIKEVREAEL